MERLDDGLKSQSYGRFGFGISQADREHGPFTLTLIGSPVRAGQLTSVYVGLTEAQGLLLLADLGEFAAKVMRRVVEASIFQPTS